MLRPGLQNKSRVLAAMQRFADDDQDSDEDEDLIFMNQ
jgi:hypothetical protein